ncbi:hypothetical protein MPOCJGCO_0894 [Methylobacterium trifolii]|uniref:Uncharacterized protein n=1 Tax=Methylobacterium trifolii TaxID=1003092 RepID=A0ABQ4TUA4_9HYPH|nr:hypothetical protein MPOCJGCO_0894 [Methylobacterium trifolii]
MTGTVILTAFVTLVAAGAFPLASVAQARRSGLRVDSLREEARQPIQQTSADVGGVTV